MGVAGIEYTKAHIEAALFRSAGVPLKSYAYGPATNPDSSAPGSNRNYKPSGKKVGHVYIHVKGGGDDTTGRQSDLANRSRFADLETTIGALVEAMKHVDVKAALQRLDALASPQEWLHGAHAIPVTGAWYGYPRNSGALRKIKTIAINLRSHGDALFISSVYPEGFQTYADVLSGS